jgi:hypothetical protein
MTTANKRYSNLRVTTIRIDVLPAGENLTNMPHAFHARSAYGQTIHNSRGQCIATFHEVINRFIQIHCHREEVLPTQSAAQRPSDPWVNTQLLSHNSQWGSEEKTSFCWQLATRLTGPISPICDRYVQYLLTGVNSSVLNWHRRGIQHWRCRLSTYHSPTFPTDGLPFPPTGPVRYPVYPKSIN